MKALAFVLCASVVPLTAGAQTASGRAESPAAKDSKPDCNMTGEIVSLTYTIKESKIEMKSLDGALRDFDVDAAAVPGFHDRYKVGQRVTVGCKLYPEVGYKINSIRPAP